jgi:hypothetical protein
MALSLVDVLEEASAIRPPTVPQTRSAVAMEAADDVVTTPASVVRSRIRAPRSEAVVSEAVQAVVRR